MNFLEDIDWKGVGEVTFYILLSFGCFRLLQFAVRWYLFGKCTFRTFSYFRFARRSRRRHPPDSQDIQVVPPNKKWRISNEAVSLIHSAISGAWALYTIVNYRVFDDMVMFRNQFALYLIYMSFGYIAHDLVDLLINERSVRIIELLFHHVMVIVAFMTTLVTQKFLAVVIFGLLMEVNSIFLHSRSLMNLYRQPKTSVGFKMIALLNIVSFMIFRIAVSVYLLKWQFTEAWKMEWYYTVVTFIVIVSLSTVNTILLYRVIVLPTRHTHAESNATSSTAVVEETPAPNPAVSSATPMV
ncbi:hypothetical protein FO519_005097 [Halicephalobus sp. NKZ332]|nr:hypothetical protein FO519_005097 [Halicephalobus sp. NKZ332]